MSVERSIKALRGTKKIDLFQPSRLDRNVTVEETMRLLVPMVKEGKFDHIGLSEVGAESLRRGHAVSSMVKVAIIRRFMTLQVYPVSLAEIEISPMSYEEETKKGA